MVDALTKKSANAVSPSIASSDSALKKRMISQLVDVLYTTVDEADIEEVALAALRAFNPKDDVEVTMAAHLAAVNHNALDCFRRAMMDNQKLAVRDFEMRHAAKMLELYGRMLPAYEKRQKRRELDKKLPNAPLALLGHFD